ncbi:Transmembrane and immunoglobulin [Mactra antiquata]
MFSSSVICLLVVASLNVCCAQNVEVRIVNPDDSSSGLHLVYETTETVVCVITNASSDPDVTFGFQDPQINDGLNLVPIKNVESVDNKYNVNVSITFVTTGTMNSKKLVCSFGGQEWTDNIDMYFPPLLTIHSRPSIASTSDPKFPTDCESISVPETTIEWFLDGVRLTQSGIKYTENQACKHTYNTNFESNSYKYVCRSNMTLLNLTKDIIGSKLECAYNYLGKITKNTVVDSMDFFYPPTEIAVENKPIKIADDTSDGLVEMTCTTSAANPIPKLEWYEDIVMKKRLNMSQYPVVVTKTPKYNGNLVTQTVQLSVNKGMNGKTIHCCYYMSYLTTSGECATTDIQVSWLKSIIYPAVNEYKVYVGAGLMIPCYVDSNPVSLIEWYKNNSKLSDNSANKTNLFGLDLTNIQKSDSGSYTCTAKLHIDDVSDPLHTISKSVNVIVIDVPPLPMVHVIESYNEKFPNIIIDTPQESSQVPQTFYVQYKKHSSSTWLEFSKPFRDSLPGQRPISHVFESSDMALQPGQYKLRVKSLTGDGMVAYTDEKSFQVKADEVEMVSKSSRTTAILLSVFITAAVFIVVIVIGVCLVKRGACSRSGSAGFN